MEKNAIYEFGAFRLDPREHLLLRAGQPVNLSPQLFSLLILLVENSGHLLTKEELRNNLWGENYYGAEAALKVIVGSLRKALGEGRNGERFIETVTRKGYRFVAGVTKIEVSAPPLAKKAPATQHPDGYPVGATAPALFPSSAEIREAAPGSQRKSMLRRHWVVASCAFALIAVVTVFSGFIFPPPTIVKYTPLTYNDRELGPPSTDGAHVYFQQNEMGTYRIGLVPAEGGETVYIPTPFASPGLVGVTANGGAMMVASAQGPEAAYLKVPLPGGSPQPLWSPPSRDIAMSPDGKQIAYAQDGGTTLSIANIDGTGARKIYSAPAGPNTLTLPGWSPDGKLVTFLMWNSHASMGKQPSSFWAIAPDGSDLHMVVPWSAAAKDRGCWTPDGKYFIFGSGEVGKYDLWAMPQRTKWLSGFHRKPVRLTNNAMDFRSPVVSPDGGKIFALGKLQLGELVRYDAQSRSFVPYLGGISAGAVSFSRDGQWVAYVKHPEGTLWRSRVDGSEKMQLTFDPMTADSPRWSPDGARITYRASRLGEPRKIFLVSGDGGVSEELLPEESEEQGVPTWAADGRSIVFGVLRFKGEKGVIRILDLADRKLTTVPGSEGLWTPRWSPSGRFLLALKADPASSNSPALLVFDFRTRQWRIVAERSINEPVWSHDEQYIYFDCVHWSADDGVFRVRVADGRIERIANLYGFPRAADYSFGVWFGLAPDDSPLLLKEARQAEIYALDVKW